MVLLIIYPIPFGMGKDVAVAIVVVLKLECHGSTESYHYQWPKTLKK